MLVKRVTGYDPLGLSMLRFQPVHLFHLIFVVYLRLNKIKLIMLPGIFVIKLLISDKIFNV